MRRYAPNFRGSYEQNRALSRNSFKTGRDQRSIWPRRSGVAVGIRWGHIGLVFRVIHFIDRFGQAQPAGFQAQERGPKLFALGGFGQMPHLCGTAPIG